MYFYVLGIFKTVLYLENFWTFEHFEQGFCLYKSNYWGFFVTKRIHFEVTSSNSKAEIFCPDEKI